MTIAFDLNKLSGIYIETMKSPEKAVAFDFKYANGKFLFMIFLSDEDEKSKDKLFVYMRNTRRLLELKMYGNHFKDKFLIQFVIGICIVGFRVCMVEIIHGTITMPLLGLKYI